MNMAVSGPTRGGGSLPLKAVVAGVLLAVSSGAADLPTAAKVVAAEGRVSVFRNGESWALFAGDGVRVGEMIVTGLDGVARLEVADGSTFEVYPNSRVVFRANPGNMKDLVEVFLGKIKVYIQTFGGRPNPYRVHSPTAVISVRGTIFDVAVETDTVTTVAVTEGVVDVLHRILPGKAVSLLPGQSLQVFPNATLAAAGINKTNILINAARLARDTIFSLPRTGGGASGSGPQGPASGPPADTPAPAPPPAPADKEAPPPPPPPGP